MGGPWKEEAKSGPCGLSHSEGDGRPEESQPGTRRKRRDPGPMAAVPGQGRALISAQAQVEQAQTGGAGRALLDHEEKSTWKAKGAGRLAGTRGGHRAQPPPHAGAAGFPRFLSVAVAADISLEASCNPLIFQRTCTSDRFSAEESNSQGGN